MNQIIKAFYLNLTIFFLLFDFTNCQANGSVFFSEGNDDDMKKASKCVLSLSAKYFVEKRALSGSIVIININSYLSKTQAILLPIIHEGKKYSVMVKDSSYPHFNASHFPEKAQNYMLILEEKEELKRNILQLNKLPTWNPHAKAVIFYELRENDDEIKTVMKFINDLRAHKMLKTFVFTYNSSSRLVKSFSWQPYDATHCGGECDNVFVLDECGPEGQVQINPNVEKFPLDMNGCPLVVFAVICEPYVMPPVKKVTNTLYDDTYQFELGIEVNLLKIIAHFTNLTLIIRKSDIPDGWGEITLDGNATEAYGLLRNDSVDVIIGNMQVDRTIRKWFDPTSSYMQDDIAWCVPKAGISRTWTNLVTIFQWNTWTATLFSWIGISFLFHLCYFLENKKRASVWPTNSLLMSLSMLLGWGSRFHPKSISFRLLLGAWLLFSINLVICYGSFLRGFLLHPRYEHQVMNEINIKESNLDVGGRNSFKAFLSGNNTNDIFFYNNYKTMLFLEAIKKTAFERNFATLSSRRQAAYQDQELAKGAKLIYCFSEKYDLYKYGVVILARKWFPMLQRFDEIIRNVVENGMIWKWSREAFTHSAGKTDRSNVESLGMEHLKGAFLFIGFMYGVCFAVFTGEIIIWFIIKKLQKYNLFGHH